MEAGIRRHNKVYARQPPLFYFLTGGALHKQKQITSRNNESSLYISIPYSSILTATSRPHCQRSQTIDNELTLESPASEISDND